jgi:hypothetical protein
MRNADNSLNQAAPSEGARRLKLAGSIEEIAAEVRCSARSVAAWRSGASLPSYPSRGKLLAAYPTAKDRPPSWRGRRPVCRNRARCRWW